MRGGAAEKLISLAGRKRELGRTEMIAWQKQNSLAGQLCRTALYCCLEGQPRLLRGVGRLWLVMRKHRFILWRNYRESNIIEEGHKCRLIHIEVDKTYYLCFLLSSSTTNISARPNSPLQNISDKNLIKTYLKIALNFELSQKSILLNLLTFSL